MDEKGEKYVLDKWGNKVYLQTNANGQMFYMDHNGMMILIPWGQEVKDAQGGWLVCAGRLRFYKRVYIAISIFIIEKI